MIERIIPDCVAAFDTFDEDPAFDEHPAFGEHPGEP